MKEKKNSLASRLLTLLFSTFTISACTFGGGFVIVTLMKRKFVDELHWLDEQEMLDFTALAQSSPGAIAVNAAVLVGWKAAGLPGMLTAVTGTILPPLLILTAISFFYAAFAANPYVAILLRGMAAGVAAVIIDVVLSLGGKLLEKERLFNTALAAAAFALSFFGKVNVIYIILGAMAIGVLRAALLQRRKKA